ncbi:MAG: acyltransferase [Azonexus sp.]|nr:acyltransferase [Betaproteobacteria bacterium]MBP6035448.1 acyltransferase [Azonexus sp.]MBP6906428.1 acyltransferase [Azonexus sp.]
MGTIIGENVVFGIFRLTAALLVVVTHIGGVEFFAGAAVWGFFMLSGLLMTAALNTRYGLDVRGLACFLLSRARRLYPTYWFCLFLTCLVLWAAQDFDRARLVNSALGYPSALGEWIANIFIVGQTTFGLGRTQVSLSPSSWAVDVEILMYFCSCLFLARSRRIALATLVLLGGLFPLLWWHARGLVKAGEVALAGQVLYSFLPAALLPYAIGSLMWFWRQRYEAVFRGRHSLIVAGVLGIVVCAFLVHPKSVTLAYLMSLPCLMLILGTLMHVRAGGGLRSLDEFAGHMSYPLYLLHWLCAYLFVLIVPDSLHWASPGAGRYSYNLAAFVCVSILALAVSGLTAWLVEAPLERRRHDWLKSRMRPGSEDGTDGVDGPACLGPLPSKRERV